ncbi:hypothetical protein L1049_024993 [Liquidambar formosana]|uniref:FHA domain-containing protein n=1 Tax=Liquidambar formosana TaxID=63359 RepID=A0AAP0RW28_LIQFO
MVWGLSPVDPLPGEDKYYIFTKGTYKVGRKGCHVIINKDKGVSRIHAEIIIDAMTSLNPLQNKPSNVPSKVRIRDCSKYGTFINKNLESEEKVHDFQNRETTLKDGDLVSFGTGNATYRFGFVPLIFFVYCLEPIQVNHPLQDKVSSIGACTTHYLSSECTHVLVDQFMSVKEDLVDAIVAKKPFVLSSWVEFVAEKGIRTEIPSCSSHAPTLTVEGLSVKVANPKARETCLEGYTFVMESTHKYKFRDRLPSLLEVCGAKIFFVEEFCSSSQGLEDGEKNRVGCVIPAGAADKFDRFHNLRSVSRMNEMDLICAVLAGYLDPSTWISPSVLLSSSCSTDETVVADSDAEAETATSVHTIGAVSTEEATKYKSKVEISTDHANTRSEDSHIMTFRDRNDGMTMRVDKVDDSESGNSDVIYSQDLIVRDVNLPASVSSTTKNRVLNFKCFRMINTQSGNSFSNLIPFSKYPYKDSEYGSEEVVESLKEEKKRKQMEAIADDLFNNEKARRRGVAGSLRGLLTRG